MRVVISVKATEQAAAQTEKAENELPHPIRTAAVIGALGVVFGDIGTSPLYAFRESFRVAMQGGADVHMAVLGVLSMIFWALTITISTKYLMFILRADNEGEGGVMALITGLGLNGSRRGFGAVLLTAGLLGAAMLFGDGVITPAISVLSAIEGVQVVAPSLDRWVIYITMGVLISVFMSQRFGTERIGMLYGPLTLCWFLAIGAVGLNQILQMPAVLDAFNPGYAVLLVMNHPELSAALIGVVFLAVTGGEALFADMGHFGRGVIRVAWFAVVMPCLLLNYFGQGALMLARNGAVENPFFEISPDWFGIPLLALATVATVIASQAMITGAFAIARQAIEIGYFPPMRIKSTSDQNSLHIFIPRLNMAMMTVTLAIVVIFQSSARLASAYGIAVAVSMLMTSVLFFYWMMKKSGWPKLLAIPLCAVFVLLDSSYVLSNLMKTFEGGWLPLLMGAFVLTAMVAWHRGLEKLVDRHLEYTEPLVDFAARTSRAPLSLVKHTGIFFSRTGTMAPVPLERMADMLHIKFARMVIITIRIESRPYVRAEKRLFAETIGTNILKIEVHYGYQQAINIPATIGATLAEHGIDTDEALYIIGHERVIAPPDPGNVFDLMNILFAILAATAERSVDRFCLPATRTLEIGYPVHLQD